MNPAFSDFWQIATFEKNSITNSAGGWKPQWRSNDAAPAGMMLRIDMNAPHILQHLPMLTD